MSGFWLSKIHFLSFSGKQFGINIISPLPLPVKGQALPLDLNPGHGEGEAENSRTGPHQPRTSLGATACGFPDFGTALGSCPFPG